MSELLDQLAAKGTNATKEGADVQEATSQLARDPEQITTTGNSLRGHFDQNERLFVARSRSALTANQASNQYPVYGADLGGNRGQWAFIKLLTSKSQYDEYVSGTTQRFIASKQKRQLIGEDGIVTQMADPVGDSTTGGYDRFLITGVQSQMSEKVQVTEVFGDNEVVYYFGRDPVFFSIQGLLIDSPDNNWFTDWLTMYSEFLRGTQLARNAELLKLVLPNMTIIGTIQSFQWSQDSSRDVDIPFSFQFVAKQIIPSPAVGAIQTFNGMSQIDFSKVSEFTSQADINSFKNQVNSLTGVLMDPLSTLGDKSAALAQLGSGTGGLSGGLAQDSRGTLGNFQSTIASWDRNRASFFDTVQSSGMFQSVTSSLLSVRMNLFAPIYGIMSSLSKLVINTFNSTVGLFNSVINPVRNILRDVTNISNQAVALVNLVNSAVTGVGRVVTGGLNGLAIDFNTAIRSLGRAAGSIATAPQTVAQSIAHMFAGSQLDYNAPFLQTSSKLTFTRPVLPLGGLPPPTKASLMAGIIPLDIKHPVL